MRFLFASSSTEPEGIKGENICCWFSRHLAPLLTYLPSSRIFLGKAEDRDHNNAVKLGGIWKEVRKAFFLEDLKKGHVKWKGMKWGSKGSCFCLDK